MACKTCGFPAAGIHTGSNHCIQWLRAQLDLAKADLQTLHDRVRALEVRAA